ncbi:hypothetical protein DCC39_18250 [Pueribacillus theae]|uniref:Gamma-glutamylcyclotransferase AIG2-like domain-containing protein n=1 Tax=Pueribacillus theae TaxID=2171751 RepID=A0A2U1JJU9_9BACI|nr:gamma-glutamylcyclotransferase family protein [Pueribacillus theae]PWA05274.1 hypothetical protein DCC39_18250 [Pueribacillus theae]
MKMFTYGTLKDVEMLKEYGATDIAENAYVKGYQMYSYRNGFPITKKTGYAGDIIYGTLFSIPKEVVLYTFDRIENYVPGRERIHNMYNRERVFVRRNDRLISEFEIAHMYLANEDYFIDHYIEENLIESGLWEDAVKEVMPWNLGK